MKSSVTAAFSPYDAADYLKSNADIAAYLKAAADDGDPAVLVAALGDVAKARNPSGCSKAIWSLPRRTIAMNSQPAIAWVSERPWRP